MKQPLSMYMYIQSAAIELIHAKAHYRCHLNRSYRVDGGVQPWTACRAWSYSVYAEECRCARTYVHTARRPDRDLRLGSPEIDSTLAIRRKPRQQEPARHDLRPE